MSKSIVNFIQYVFHVSHSSLNCKFYIRLFVPPTFLLIIFNDSLTSWTMIYIVIILISCLLFFYLCHFRVSFNLLLFLIMCLIFLISACLVIFYWISDIVNFVFWCTEYIVVLLKLLEWVLKYLRSIQHCTYTSIS